MKYNWHNPAAMRRAQAVLAALACAFFLASCVASGEVTVGADSVPVPTAPAVAVTPEAEAPVAMMDPDEQAILPVLVVTEGIAQGTLARALIDAPTVYLSAQALPEDVVDPAALSSLAELAELADLGFALTADVLPGDQLLRSSFADIGIAFSDAAATPVVETPPELEAQVLILAPSQALGGLIRTGERVRIIATSVGADGQAVSTSLVDEVGVLGVETVVAPDAINAAGPRELAVTIALEIDDASRLSTALADATTITLASPSTSPDNYAVGIQLTQAQALGGAARAGNVVHVVALRGPRDLDGEPSVVASDVELLNVSADLASEEPDYYVIASVSTDELLALTAAVAAGDIALAEP